MRRCHPEVPPALARTAWPARPPRRYARVRPPQHRRFAARPLPSRESAWRVGGRIEDKRMSPVQNEPNRGPAGGARNFMHGSRLRRGRWRPREWRLWRPKPKSHGAQPGMATARNRSGSARHAAGRMIPLACLMSIRGSSHFTMDRARAVSASTGASALQEKERSDASFVSPVPQ